MNHGIIVGFTCLFLLLSLAGFCVAEEAPEYSLYIQGGESSITEDADGGMQITIQDVIPYVFSANGNKSLLLPVRSVSRYSFPMNPKVPDIHNDIQKFNLNLKLFSQYGDKIKYYLN